MDRLRISGRAGTRANPQGRLVALPDAEGRVLRNDGAPLYDYDQLDRVLARTRVHNVPAGMVWVTLHRERDNKPIRALTARIADMQVAPHSPFVRNELPADRRVNQQIQCEHDPWVAVEVDGAVAVRPRNRMLAWQADHRWCMGVCATIRSRAHMLGQWRTVIDQGCIVLINQGDEGAAHREYLTSDRLDEEFELLRNNWVLVLQRLATVNHDVIVERSQMQVAFGVREGWLEARKMEHAGQILPYVATGGHDMEQLRSVNVIGPAPGMEFILGSTQAVNDVRPVCMVPRAAMRAVFRVWRENLQREAASHLNEARRVVRNTAAGTVEHHEAQHQAGLWRARQMECDNHRGVCVYEVCVCVWQGVCVTGELFSIYFFFTCSDGGEVYAAVS